MQRLQTGVSDGVLIEYSEDGKQLSSSQPIQWVFEEWGESRLENNICIGDSYRMGWSTAAVFKKENDQFRIMKVKSINGTEKEDMDGIVNHRVTQIMTQAVDTCTLIYIEVASDIHLLAHFNKSDLGEFYEAYCQEYIEKSNKIFCSWAEEQYREENVSAYDAIKDRRHCWSLNRGLFGGLNSKDNEPRALSHMEFGICIEEGTMKFFGDVCFRDIHTLCPGTDKNECDCRLFECDSIEALGTTLNSFRDDFPAFYPRRGSSCLIF